MTVRANDTPPGNRRFLWALLLVVAGFVVFRFGVEFTRPPPAPDKTIVPQAQPDREEVTVALRRGDFTFHFYLPGTPPFAARPKALIIFGSGDGGFDGWEDRVCKSLQADGQAVIGFDCAAYAKTDYDLATLQADMTTLAGFASARFAAPPPLILGGWSMGAVQAVAAAGGPNPPGHLVGVLAISPGDRGRYGLRAADRWDVPPTGPGTFALTDFAHRLDHVRVVQWDGKFDLVDSTKWLDSLTGPHRAFLYASGVHDYAGASDDFLLALRQSIAWILSP